ncbi:hypothetical protein [Acrocarpospora phusangensis]|uniref:hypothetical protein n=1 Tax=Acrocarpospora phusangensis TaxID=1070424 RepID=UPI0019518FE3|nr:hypothetical protein [Acrocarpospora phusangensis]
MIVVGLYLAAATVGAVVSAVTGSADALWLTVTWYPLDDSPFGTSSELDDSIVLLFVLLFATLMLRAWAFWQIFSFPPRGERPADRRVVWLRRLLYLAVADDLILWTLRDLLLPDTAVELLTLVLWTPLEVLFVLVLTGRSGAFRALALTLAGLNAVAVAASAVDELPGVRAPQILMSLGLAHIGWMIMIILGQREDGRWSEITVSLGRISLVLSLAGPVINFGFLYVIGTATGGLLIHLLSAFGVVSTVWLARSAHEVAVAPEEKPRGSPAWPAARQPS